MIMRSGGGAMTFGEAADRAVETILSGPVAGARAVAELARELDVEHAVAADVGGTSFDTCLIDHGRPPVLYEGAVVGLPIQTRGSTCARSAPAGDRSPMWMRAACCGSVRRAPVPIPARRAMGAAAGRRR